MNAILLLLFRVVLVPAALSGGILLSVAIDKLSRLGFISMSVPGQEAQAVGLLILFVGVPGVILIGWVYSGRLRSRPKFLLACIAVMLAVTAWVILELLQQQDRFYPPDRSNLLHKIPAPSGNHPHF